MTVFLLLAGWLVSTAQTAFGALFDFSTYMHILHHLTGASTYIVSEREYFSIIVCCSAHFVDILMCSAYNYT